MVTHIVSPSTEVQVLDSIVGLNRMGIPLNFKFFALTAIWDESAIKAFVRMWQKI